MADGQVPASSTDPLVIGTRELDALWQMAGWDDFETRAGAALRELGLPGVGSYRAAQSAGSVTSWRIAPDRLLVEGAGDLGRFHSGEFVLLDLSHARSVITLSGPPARDVLSLLTAVDVSAAAFLPGQFLQVGIHGIGVLLACLGPEDFELFVPTTWAASIQELILDNAKPYGVRTRQLE
ncbi:MAG: hypothetical protein NXH97_03995 [Rhodobacteraceae bacterium]|nr:hypothetical protein [Paracoccaceae bacterium]